MKCNLVLLPSITLPSPADPSLFTPSPHHFLLCLFCDLKSLVGLAYRSMAEKYYRYFHFSQKQTKPGAHF